MMFWGGPCPPLYIRGDRVTWKVLAEYSWSPTTTQSGSFLCTAASSTPIRVVTKEVRYIHKLSLTLEHSMPISSPAAPGLTLVLFSFYLCVGRTWFVIVSMWSEPKLILVFYWYLWYVFTADYTKRWALAVECNWIVSVYSLHSQLLVVLAFLDT